MTASACRLRRSVSTAAHRSRWLVLVVLPFAMAGYGTVALAADAGKGRVAAGQCSVCHGKDGLATVPDAPNLAGESAIYIEKQLMAFKRGEREHRQMSLIATGLEDQTIKDLAAWFESMQVTVTLPE